MWLSNELGAHCYVHYYHTRAGLYQVLLSTLAELAFFIFLDIKFNGSLS